MTVTVADLMSHPVIQMPADAEVLLADEVMRLHHVRHLPVTKDGRLVGLVSHRDLLRAQARMLLRLSQLPKSDEGTRFCSLPVSELMVREVHSVASTTPAADAAALLLRHKYGCLPVVDAADKLVGIVTEVDFLRWAIEALRRQDGSA
ncbi:MAG: CBS domain-containing protein [Polyangiales bacterium]